MPISRLRLRLVGGFSLVLGVTLGLVVVAGLWQQWREARRRFDARLEAVAVAVDHALVQQMQDDASLAVRDAAASVARRWPRDLDAFAVLDAQGVPLAMHDPRGLAPRILEAARHSTAALIDAAADGSDARALRYQASVADANTPVTRLDILTFDSTEGIERDIERLTSTLLVVTPIVILISLAGGYLLAGRALLPMDRLGLAIDAIGPEDLAARVPLPPEPGELTALTRRVNTLLERVEVARLRHQRFVRETAHQIRTPLTLILGEATRAPHDESPDPALTGLTLSRIRLAAEQMRRRVDELLLFAEAESGTDFRRDDVVELDDLALECTDLMRGRAAALGRSLSLVDLAPLSVRGNAALLSEALLEMLENACRHGGSASPVTVGTAVFGEEVHLVVRSSLPAEEDPRSRGSGLGVAILEWIAHGHGGRFEGGPRGDHYEARLVLGTS